MFESALSWAERGFAVFRLQPKSKIHFAGTRGCKDATRDPQTIGDWWKKYPQANIGVAMGGGFFALDLDEEEAQNWLVSTVRIHGGITKTLTVRTARGWRLIFGSLTEVFDSASVIAQKVDIRGAGGYIIAPPSVHPSGIQYKLARDLPVAEAPQWLIKLAARAPEHRPRPSLVSTAPLTWLGRNEKLRSVEGILSFLSNARKGERNKITFWAACRFQEMVAQGIISHRFAEELLLRGGGQCGLSGREIMNTMRSASKRSRANG